MFALENTIADSFDGQKDPHQEGGGCHALACETVASMLTLCGRIANDAAFARQVRRKHTQQVVAE